LLYSREYTANKGKFFSQEVIAVFETQRVLTRGIAENLSAYQIERIWQQLESRKRKNSNLDYLQVFSLAGQEIWVIDDGNATTMLFPSEY
jgi:hypothetical protein